MGGEIGTENFYVDSGNVADLLSNLVETALRSRNQTEVVSLRCQLPCKFEPDPRGGARDKCGSHADQSTVNLSCQNGAMRIATWNINSIRSRADRALAFLERSDVDVLALQETKCKVEQFPVELFHDAGYEVAVAGLNQWNGVALLSRVGMENVRTSLPIQPAFGKPGKEAVVEPRAIGATCGGVDVWSLYVPNGRSNIDPHYQYKLEFLQAVAALGEAELLADPDALVAFVGDWNVAPRDGDVWDIELFRDQLYVTDPERAALQAVVDAGYAEVTRDHTPDRYTFWDYQQLRFPKNEGMRIDFAHFPPALAAAVTSADIDRDERKGKGASDHVPVIVDIEL